MGRPQQARKRLRQGLEIARKLQMPYDEALLYFEQARRLGPSDPLRAEALSAAEHLFSRSGARHGQALTRTLGAGEERAPFSSL